MSLFGLSLFGDVTVQGAEGIEDGEGREECGGRKKAGGRKEGGGMSQVALHVVRGPSQRQSLHMHVSSFVKRLSLFMLYVALPALVAPCRFIF